MTQTVAIKPLLAHKPEVTPPGRWRLYFLPALMAIVGIIIANAAANWGQDHSRLAVQRQLEIKKLTAKTAYLEAILTQQDPAQVVELAEALERAVAEGVPSYRREGRVFTQWDGYRYEEIIDGGYVYHQPDDPPSVRADSVMRNPDWTEPRLKNVVWYPLYPLLGYITKTVTGLPTHHALTLVSQLCLVAGSVVLFALARRHFFNRMPVLSPDGMDHVSRRWDLAPPDTAALWTVAFLVFNPAGIFFYANYTESLFILLLAAFLWCIQGRHWYLAAGVALIAASCRSQGVLFGPVLAVTYLLRSDVRNLYTRFSIAALLGLVSSIGLVAYMTYLYARFDDPFAFMAAQKHWNVGINAGTFFYALNPVNSLANFFTYALRPDPDWPRLWEAFCVIYPPVLLMLLGARFLSFEQEVIGWILWGLPYVSNALAASSPHDTHWMSMGRFMAAAIPLHLILGAILVRVRWLSPILLALSVAMFALFSYMYGWGHWVG